MTQTLQLEGVRTQVDHYLEHFYTAQIAQAALLSPDYAELWKTMLLVHRAGGKRIRPYMLLLTYQSLGGKRYEAILPVAAALELIHGFMLIHDDIIDRDYLRHGQLNVAGHYRQRYVAAKAKPALATHLAMSAALLAGDLLIPAAYQLVLESTLPDSQKVLATSSLGEVIFVVGGGEFLDSEIVLQPFETADPLTVATLKTSHYSFLAPLTLGAKLARASKAVYPNLRKFGEALGIAFQLTDDVLDIFGDSKITGKPASDIRQGKRTYLMCEAYKRASQAERTELDALLGKETIGPKQVERVQAILQDCGARAATEATIATHRAKALKALWSLQLNQEAQTQFEALVALTIDKKA